MHANADANEWRNDTGTNCVTSIVKCRRGRHLFSRRYAGLFSFYANNTDPPSILEKERILITHSGDNLLDNTAGANCTVREDRCTDGRNSIITSGRGFARRQQECRATREEPWLCIRKRNDVGERRAGEGDARSRRCRRRRCRRTSRTTTTTAAEMERRSPGARNSSSKCSLRDSGGGMRADKKLGNVLIPWTRGPARTTSYSELYRRRFS